VERHYLERALSQTDGNRTRATRLLGLSKSHHNLSNRLQKHPELLEKYAAPGSPKTSSLRDEQSDER
jgi:DNA-binding NtrC family response regulator